RRLLATARVHVNLGVGIGDVTLAGVVEDVRAGAEGPARALVSVEGPVDVDLAVAAADLLGRIGEGSRCDHDLASGGVERRVARAMDGADLVDGPIGVEHDLDPGPQVVVVERMAGRMALEHLEVAE